MTEQERNHKLFALISKRERQVLELAAAGSTDHGIAHKLGIRTTTVNSYWVRIRKKVGNHTRPELVAIMLRIDFEREISELKAALAAAQGKPKKYECIAYDPEVASRLYESFPEPLLLVDAMGKIQCCNRVCSEFFGYKNKDLEGASIEVLLPERFRDSHGKHLLAYASEPGARRMRNFIGTYALLRSGREHRITASLNAINTKKGLMFICSFRAEDGEITDPAQAEG